MTALLAGGGYAEYARGPGAAVPADPARPRPRDARRRLPETFFTVWTNVFERGRLDGRRDPPRARRHQRHRHDGDPDGRALRRARLRDGGLAAKRCRACERLGAERGIDRNTEDFVALTRELTSGRGVDVILDMVGGDYLPRNLAALAEGGRLVQIAYLRGAKARARPATRVMQRRLTITGSTLRPRSVAEKGAIAAALRAKVWPLLEAGKLRPLIHATFPFAEAAAAHALLETNEVVGKIVLLP